MPITIAEFKAQVSAEINQGTRLDSSIPGAMRRAALFIERNHSFTYMDRFVEIDLDVSAEDARFMSWPLEEGLSLMKKIEFIRYSTVLGGQTSYTFLKPTQPNLIQTIESDAPAYYWLTGSPDGLGYIVLDQIGSENLTFEMQYKSFSIWPTASNATHWLLDRAEDLMIAQTMMQLAPLAEEPEWLQKYLPMWKSGMVSLLNAEQELTSGGDPLGYQTVMQ